MEMGSLSESKAASEPIRKAVYFGKMSVEKINSLRHVSKVTYCRKEIQVPCRIVFFRVTQPERNLPFHFNQHVNNFAILSGFKLKSSSLGQGSKISPIFWVGMCGMFATLTIQCRPKYFRPDQEFNTQAQTRPVPNLTSTSVHKLHPISD